MWTGITEDDRNTDNAWVESTAYSIHDDTGTGVGKFTLEGGDDAVDARWTTVHQNIRLFVNHRHMVETVVAKVGAYW